MFDSTQAKIDHLTIIQRQLDAAKARQVDLEAEVRADRKAAAGALRTKQTLEARAAAEEANVESLLAQHRAIEEAAADDVAEDKAQYAKLTRERASVEQRIAIRIAKAKAAAARKAAADKAAKIAALKAAAAERARKAQERTHRGSTKTRHKATSKNSNSSSAKAAHKKASRAVHDLGQPRVLVSGIRIHYVTVRDALSSSAALLEAARRNRLRGGLRDRDPSPVLRSSRGALLQRGLRKPADDRPRFP